MASAKGPLYPHRAADSRPLGCDLLLGVSLMASPSHAQGDIQPDDDERFILF